LIVCCGAPSHPVRGKDSGAVDDATTGTMEATGKALARTVRRRLRPPARRDPTVEEDDAEFWCVAMAAPARNGLRSARDATPLAEVLFSVVPRTCRIAVCKDRLLSRTD
jgi:hypothetical protein